MGSIWGRFVVDTMSMWGQLGVDPGPIEDVGKEGGVRGGATLVAKYLIPEFADKDKAARRR